MAFNKTTAPTPKAQGKPKTGMSPVKSLCFSKRTAEGEEKSELQNICGLFPAADKKGNGYFRGKNREDGLQYYVQPNNKEGDFDLTVAEDTEEEGKKKFTKVCHLKKIEKGGKIFFVGEDADKDSWFMFDVKPK